ncbi:SDR family NAD(P)-dependent oxidoreductase [Alkalimonas collagenimarina]|uniref:SDR family NAD(P)-dependent oxidoreductase n=1 Tax=Alkalimonas collagenimarina TaxID=400390 RepID=A0ABT9GUD3_9GAMM|nr:SDR family NAD(P)-dependent oxidoreductase [Alkalimonas collagenimarina]MDP4534661.1 SDR family NAD(P)-dependent oxidoreductase [Alkalimonas collagenimarina]
MKSCFITGASSGIGRALACHYAHNGWRVYAVARSEAALQELSLEHSTIVPMACDLTDSAALSTLVAEITADCPSLDLVILNAGTCIYVDAEQLQLSDFEQTFAINFFAIVALVPLLLPLLKAGQQSQLAIVSSLAHVFPFTKAEAYGASKAAVSYFTESLRVDWSGNGVDVCLIEPGFVDTPLTKKNEFDMPFLISSDEAVKRISQGIAQRRARIRFPKRLVWSLNVLRILPYRLRLVVARGMKP